jgi:hypothetical protein
MALLSVVTAVVLIGHVAGAEFYYADALSPWSVEGEAPHVFADGDEWVVHTVHGTRESGYWRDEQRYARNVPFSIDVVFPRDGSGFSVPVHEIFPTPPVRYNDGQPVVAISDIEGNYGALRDFLMASEVIDANLEWTFGAGHLVLVGDFVDRGPSVTHVLWFIFRLEQLAAAQGGHVHYILGNHELKQLHGDFQAAHRVHTTIATVLGRPQAELFGDDALLGRWLLSKNTAEVINGTLFVHGGLHPSLADQPYALEDVNRVVRASYRRVWYPARGAGDDDVLINPATGPSWYRGYFKDKLTQAQVTQALARFGATTVVVGHTLQPSVRSRYDDAVIAIDVRHPWDYRRGLPSRRSEGVRMEGGTVWRVLGDGRRVGA